MMLEHGTYSQKINQSNNLAGHNDDKTLETGKILSPTNNTAKPPINKEYNRSKQGMSSEPKQGEWFEHNMVCWSHIKRKQHGPGAGKRSLKHKQN